MKLRIESLEDLTLLTDAVIAGLPDSEDADVAVLGEDLDSGSISPMDPLVGEILEQAESAGGEAFELELEGEYEEQLLAALDAQMERFAAAGDLFRIGDLQAILRELGRA